MRAGPECKRTARCWMCLMPQLVTATVHDAAVALRRCKGMRRLRVAECLAFRFNLLSDGRCEFSICCLPVVSRSCSPAPTPEPEADRFAKRVTSRRLVL